MPSRYYFLASLPMLRFTDDAPLSWDSFLAQAKGNISEGDYALICGLPENKTGRNGFLKQWKKFNADLDGAINAKRRENLGRAEEAASESYSYEIEQLCKAAVNAKDPLEAELFLMRCRYEYLEEKIGFDVFSQTALLAYALQLQILLRKGLFTREAGNAEYKKLFGILQKEMKME